MGDKKHQPSSSLTGPSGTCGPVRTQVYELREPSNSTTGRPCTPGLWLWGGPRKQLRSGWNPTTSGLAGRKPLGHPTFPCLPQKGHPTSPPCNAAQDRGLQLGRDPARLCPLLIFGGKMETLDGDVTTEARLEAELQPAVSATLHP